MSDYGHDENPLEGFAKIFAPRDKGVEELALEHLRMEENGRFTTLILAATMAGLYNPSTTPASPVALADLGESLDLLIESAIKLHKYIKEG